MSLRLILTESLSNNNIRYYLFTYRVNVFLLDQELSQLGLAEIINFRAQYIYNSSTNTKSNYSWAYSQLDLTEIINFRAQYT